MLRFADTLNKSHVRVRPAAYLDRVLNGDRQKTITFKLFHPPTIAIITSITIDVTKEGKKFPDQILAVFPQVALVAQPEGPLPFLRNSPRFGCCTVVFDRIMHGLDHPLETGLNY